MKALAMLLASLALLAGSCFAQVPDLPPPGLCPIGEEEGGCAPGFDGGLTVLDGAQP
jgi:hypothetical protein